MNSDFRDFFVILIQHQVEFLLIGGVAFNFHAPPRATKDIDVWVRPSRDNIERLVGALRAFGLPTAALDVDVLSGPTAQIVMLGRVPNRIDVLTRPAGLDWQDAWVRRVSTDYGDARIGVLDLETLLKAKLAAGRPRDLADAAVLEAIRKSRL